ERQAGQRPGGEGTDARGAEKWPATAGERPQARELVTNGRKIVAIDGEGVAKHPAPGGSKMRARRGAGALAEGQGRGCARLAGSCSGGVALPVPWQTCNAAPARRISRRRGGRTTRCARPPRGHVRP